MTNKNLFLFTLSVALLVGCNSSNDTHSSLPQSELLPESQRWERLVDSTWVAFRVVGFKYDQDQQLIEELTQSIAGDSLIFETRIRNEYDVQGNKTLRTLEIWKEGTWALARKSSYQLDSSKVTQRVDSLTNNDNSTVIVTAYQYNDAGQLLVESGRRIGKEKANHSRIVYSYNEAGLISKKEFPVWNEGKWENKRMMMLEYDSNNFHIKTTRFNWVENAWAENIRYDLEVDKEGNRVGEVWSRNGMSYMRVTNRFFSGEN